MNMNIQDHIFGEVCVLVLNDCAHCNHKALNAFIHWESKDQNRIRSKKLIVSKTNSSKKDFHFRQMK